MVEEGPRPRACPLCGVLEYRETRLTTDRWQVVECQRCAMTFLRNPPAFEALSAEFDWAQTRVAERQRRRRNGRLYYFFSDSFKRAKHVLRRGRRKELDFVRRHAPARAGNFLDVGCADGGTLRELDRQLWVCFGIEPSADLAGKADQYCQATGGRVVNDVAVRALLQFSSDFFQCIMMRSYLEHEVHFPEVLSAAHRVLAEDGVLILKVPNYACWNSRWRGASWPGVRLPDHVNYFRPRDLVAAVHNAGFRGVFCPWRFRLPTSDNLWMVVSREPRSPAH